MGILSKLSLLSLPIIFFAFSGYGEIKTPRVISDNMVLQREKPVKIWGTAKAGAKVDVEFFGQRKSAVASADGEWSVVLDSMPASKKPLEMAIFENGKEAKRLGNILVGEVWVLGGQSNMAWPLEPTIGGEKAVASANYPHIRCFRQGRQFYPDTYLDKKFGMFEKTSMCSLDIARKPQKDSPAGSRWEISSPDNVPIWSAIGFYFAEMLAKRYDVPVGLLYTPIGGSPMIAWIPESEAVKNAYLLRRSKEMASALKAWDNGGYQKAVAEHERKIADRKRKIAELKSRGKRIKSEPYRYYLPPNKDTPFGISSTPFFNFNAKVAPLSGYGVRGILWYQGESDTQGTSRQNFREQLEILVAAWRECFGGGDIPFIQAQLSSFGKSSNWPEIRAKQLEFSRGAKNAFTVCTADIGDKKDVHPRNKSEVAARMFNMARSQVYGDSSVKAFSPVAESCVFEGGMAAVSLNGFGLEIELCGEARGFEILADGKWRRCAAELKNGKLELKSKGAAKIDGARYLWSQYPQEDVCVYGEGGLPLFPFSFEREAKK